MREKALECSGCGLPRDETMAKENQFVYVSEPIRCHACAARDREAQRFHGIKPDPKAVSDSAGIRFLVKEIDGR